MRADEDISITEDLVPPPAPIWTCQGCGWNGPSREMITHARKFKASGTDAILCPVCHSTALKLDPYE